MGFSCINYWEKSAIFFFQNYCYLMNLKKKMVTQLRLYEVDLHPMLIILGCNPWNHLLLPNEVECYQEDCKIRLINKFTNRKIN